MNGSLEQNNVGLLSFQIQSAIDRSTEHARTQTKVKQIHVHTQWFFNQANV